MKHETIFIGYPFLFEKSCVKPVRLSSIATPALYALLAVELRPLLREIGFVSRWRIAIFAVAFGFGFCFLPSYVLAHILWLGDDVGRWG